MSDGSWPEMSLQSKAAMQTAARLPRNACTCSTEEPGSQTAPSLCRGLYKTQSKDAGTYELPGKKCILLKAPNCSRDLLLNRLIRLAEPVTD